MSGCEIEEPDERERWGIDVEWTDRVVMKKETVVQTSIEEGILFLEM